MLCRSHGQERGEEALHKRVALAASLGGHAGDDVVLAQQLAVVGGWVLADLVWMEQQRLRQHLLVTEGAAESLDRQGGIHPLMERSADDMAAEQPDPDCAGTPSRQQCGWC